MTKGRISIVWEGVNTFSDHYGKRLTLKLNVAQLVAKQRNKQSADRRSRKGSSSRKEQDDDEKHSSTKHERRPEEDDDGADDDENDS